MTTATAAVPDRARVTFFDLTEIAVRRDVLTFKPLVAELGRYLGDPANRDRAATGEQGVRVWAYEGKIHIHFSNGALGKTWFQPFGEDFVEKHSKRLGQAVRDAWNEVGSIEGTVVEVVVFRNSQVQVLLDPPADWKP